LRDSKFSGAINLSAAAAHKIYSLEDVSQALHDANVVITSGTQEDAKARPKVKRPRSWSAGPPVVCLGLAEGANAFANPSFART
jgi:hypothetical protein